MVGATGQHVADDAECSIGTGTRGFILAKATQMQQLLQVFLQTPFTPAGLQAAGIHTFHSIGNRGLLRPWLKLLQTGYHLCEHQWA